MRSFARDTLAIATADQRRPVLKFRARAQPKCATPSSGLALRGQSLLRASLPSRLVPEEEQQNYDGYWNAEKPKQ
jgi:hypothetical protein